MILDLFVNRNQDFLLPKELGTDNMSITGKTVQSVMAKKHTHKKNPLLYIGVVHQNGG